eukprot:gene14825-biopygen3624
MPGTVQEWHAEEVIFGAFWRILPAFWPPKLAKSGLKHAPQRRGYTRSLPMGPIDGRKMQFRLRSGPESCRGYPALSLTVGIRGAAQQTQGRRQSQTPGGGVPVNGPQKVVVCKGTRRQAQKK